MLFKNFILLLLHVTMFSKAFSQDTFSIVALDSATREVGSAGASCLDLYVAGYSDPTFLSKLLPDTGAVNIQSYFIQANQDNAISRLRLGETPTQVIAWLVANDANSNPEFKQHGIVAFNGIQASAKSHTGSSCISYANHITGTVNGFHYAIQGNILQGQHILDSMESKFRNTNGSLACKLMAAMQGANVAGADTRCLSQGLSSKFAFLQVAKSNDIISPSLQISLRTKNAETIEPIDSLQKLFDAMTTCFPMGIVENISAVNMVFPNPSKGVLYVSPSIGKVLCLSIYDIQGNQVCSFVNTQLSIPLYIGHLKPGVYFYKIDYQQAKSTTGNFILEK